MPWPLVVASSAVGCMDTQNAGRIADGLTSDPSHVDAAARSRTHTRNIPLTRAVRSQLATLAHLHSCMIAVETDYTESSAPRCLSRKGCLSPPNLYVFSCYGAVCAWRMPLMRCVCLQASSVSAAIILCHTGHEHVIGAVRSVAAVEACCANYEPLRALQSAQDACIRLRLSAEFERHLAVRLELSQAQAYTIPPSVHVHARLLAIGLRCSSSKRVQGPCGSGHAYASSKPRKSSHTFRNAARRKASGSG